MTETEIQALQAEIAALKTENEGFKAKKADPTPAPAPKAEPVVDDLLAKAKKDAEISNRNSSDIKRLESNLKFNLGLQDFVKQNKDLLPSEVEGILKIAEKENYDSAVDKANAVKVGIISSFFAQQSNVELLTPAQKIQLEDFLKLTKNGRDEKAEHLYENVFEPALTMMRRLKKAEEVGKARSGFATSSSVEEDYKQRLIKQARKAYLKETTV